MSVAKTLVRHARDLEPGLFVEYVRECREQRRYAIGLDGDAGPQLHLAELAKECFGENYTRRLQSYSANKEWMKESSGATDSTVFRQVIGTVAVEATQAGYALAMDTIRPAFGTHETPGNVTDPVTIPMEGDTLDEPGDVAQGMPYRRTGFSFWTVTAPAPVKNGMVAAATLELVRENKTRQFVDMLKQTGKRVGNALREKCIRVMFGITNPYVRNGSNLNTYLTSGAWVNALDDFQVANGPDEFDRLTRLFENMLDPITGKNIDVTPDTMFCVGASYFKTRSMIHATEIRKATTDANSITTTVVGSNPLDDQIKIIRDPNVRRMLVGEGGLSAAQADTVIVWGKFDEAFMMREAESGLQTFETDEQTHETAMMQDIVYMCKARTWAVPFVRDPMKVVRGRKMS